MSEFNKTKGLKRIIKTLSYSLDGLAAAIKEPAVYQLVLLHLVLIVVATAMDFDKPTTMVLVAVSFLSLIVEFFNTALEAAVDHTSMEIHPLAKRAKDIGSAAQLLAMLLIVAMWLIALF